VLELLAAPRPLMPYDEKLAAGIRSILAERVDVREQKMFGGLTFMVAGHMCCGVHRDELIVRLDPADEGRALTRAHAREMDLTKRRMPGFVTIAPQGLKGPALRRWVEQAVARTERLPPK
jgi:hypothetical protein